MKYRFRCLRGSGRRPRRHVVAGCPGAGGARARSRDLGQPLPRGAAGLQVPAGRAGDRRRRNRPHGHAVQLLRHGQHPRRHGRHLREREGSRADHAAGRRHRPRLLDAPADGRAGEGRRRRRLGPALVHGRLGFDVPHHHERGHPPRRDDGDPALRPSRHRGLRRRQARPEAAAHVQRLGAGHRRFHAGGQGRRRLGPRVRRQGLQDAEGARAVGAHHARHLRLRRAGRDLHRPREQAEQPLLLRDRSRRPTRAASSRFLRMARACWARSISARW